MTTLLLLFLTTFPGVRIAGLPTGALLETGRWQVDISHRFAIPVFASGWSEDPLQALIASNTYVALDHAPVRGLALGLGLCPTDRVAEVHALWQPSGLGRFYLLPQVSTGLRNLSLENTWFAIGAGVPLAPIRSIALSALPRFTTNTTSHYVSLGLGAKLELGPDFRLGLETEPLLYRIEPGHSGFGLSPDSLAWNLAFERELGWHNFVLTLGSARASIPPYSFRDGIVGLGAGGFRIGFHVLRKL
uniref:Uncharacterized protein n=1 Tax=candidate division WOR-3 bacterium TaxID=2052148 RepID=A0A7C4CEQ2_UNCW3